MTPAERILRIEKEIRGVTSLYQITSWEKDFMASIKQRFVLTTKQEETLSSIEGKVFGGETD